MTSFTRVAGLDLSLNNAGAAVITSPFKVEYLSTGYKLTKRCTERDRLARLVHISKDILNFLAEHKAAVVGVEDYAFASKGQTIRQGELSGIIKTQVMLKSGMSPHVVSANMIRKYLLGKATKDKKMVRKELLRLGYPAPGNLDESDALAVAHLVNGWANERAKLEADDYKCSAFEAMDFNVSKFETSQKP